MSDEKNKANFYEFSERIIPKITKLIISQTAAGADMGFFYVSLEPSLNYELGIEGLDIQQGTVASIKGNETELEIAFICPMTIKLINGYINRPGTEQIFKKLQVCV